MSTFRLGIFSSIKKLRRFNPSNLFRLFEPHRNYFERNGYPLVSPIKDFDGLIRLIATPSAGMPNDLAEALLMIEEIAESDLLETLREDNQDLFRPDREIDRADLVLELWLKKPEVLRRLHAQIFLESRQTFDHYRASNIGILLDDALTEAGIDRLQNDLDTWFQDHNQGRGTKMFRFQDDTEISFLIRHGGLF